MNWLPVCADAHGFVVNRSLFAQYDIPLPTDYASFVSACQAFEKVASAALPPITPTITPAWKRCRGFLLPS